MQLLKQQNLSILLEQKKVGLQKDAISDTVEFLKGKILKSDFMYCSILDLLKCIECKKLCKGGVTMAPCGHSFCEGCGGGKRGEGKSKYLEFCPKCGPGAAIECFYENLVLDVVARLMESHEEMMGKIQVG